MIASYESAGLGDLKKTDEEDVAGRKCSIYKSSNGKDNLTVAIDDENHLLAKLKNVTRGSADYTSNLRMEKRETSK